MRMEPPKESKNFFKKKTTYLILAFILAMVYTLDQCEAAETSMHLSPIVAVGGDIGKDSFQLGITEAFGRYEVELNLTRYESRMYKSATVRRMLGDYDFKLAFGMTWWPNWSPGTSSTMTFNLGMRYDINDKWAIDYHHNSDAGSNPYFNDGLDLISVRYKF